VTASIGWCVWMTGSRVFLFLIVGVVDHGSLIVIVCEFIASERAGVRFVCF